jgi:hypothetical protein
MYVPAEESLFWERVKATKSLLSVKEASGLLLPPFSPWDKLPCSGGIKFPDLVGDSQATAFSKTSDFKIRLFPQYLELRYMFKEQS